MNIILGLTGSVAATLAPKLYKQLSELGDVIVVETDKAKYFYSRPRPLTELKFIGDYPTYGGWTWGDIQFDKEPRIFNDQNEWALWSKKGDPVQHINLRKWADVMVVAPLTANTLAKVANGLCDNLLTSVIRAWDYRKPIVFAPAMNTAMWEHPLTKRQMSEIAEFGYDKQSSRHNTVHFVDPISKILACGDSGKGAMADIKSIIETVQKKATLWKFPLFYGNGIPINNHPGAFGYRRKHDVHTGVDLYCSKWAPVNAVESGTVVRIIPFTGPEVVIDGKKMDWWLSTKAIAVQGASGVVVYGEVEPIEGLKEGDFVEQGSKIANVIPVLPKGKERPDIIGHSLSMLHLELYTKLYEDKNRGVWESWELDKEKPEHLLDPTNKLLECRPSYHFPLLGIK